jgi:hypothetical protein
MEDVQAKTVPDAGQRPETAFFIIAIKKPNLSLCSANPNGAFFWGAHW